VPAATTPDRPEPPAGARLAKPRRCSRPYPGDTLRSMTKGEATRTDVGRTGELSIFRKTGLSLLIVYDFVFVSLGLRWRSLPGLVRSLQRPPRLRFERLDPRRLGRIVERVLRVGGHGPRCIVLSLVFLRMLRRQRTPAEIVIGLPPNPASHEAHAWVEVGGEDVGPPPGRLGQEVLARYGGEGRSKT